MKIRNLYKSSRPAGFVFRGTKQTDAGSRCVDVAAERVEIHGAVFYTASLLLGFYSPHEVCKSGQRHQFLTLILKSRFTHASRASLSELHICYQHTRANYATLINSSLSSLNMVNHVWGAKRIEIRKHEQTSVEECRVAGDHALKRCSARTPIRDFQPKTLVGVFPQRTAFF